MIIIARWSWRNKLNNIFWSTLLLLLAHHCAMHKYNTCHPPFWLLLLIGSDEINRQAPAHLPALPSAFHCEYFFLQTVTMLFLSLLKLLLIRQQRPSHYPTNELADANHLQLLHHGR